MFDWYESDQQAKTDEPTFAKQEVKERQDTRILAKRGVEVKDTESQDSTTPAEREVKEKERERQDEPQDMMKDHRRDDWGSETILTKREVKERERQDKPEDV